MQIDGNSRQQGNATWSFPPSPAPLCDAGDGDFFGSLQMAALNKAREQPERDIMPQSRSGHALRSAVCCCYENAGVSACSPAVHCLIGHDSA